MANFGLVHGAWHGGWCWGLLAAELVRRGHVCVSPDIPFDDPTSSWDSVADTMTRALDGTEGPVLVGHSLGALVIPLVALRRPVSQLVYLCPATPTAAAPPGAPDAFQDSYVAYLAAPQIDELGRDWWSPERAVRDMYQHVEPTLAKPGSTVRPWGVPRRRVIGGCGDVTSRGRVGVSGLPVSPLCWLVGWGVDVSSGVGSPGSW
jgi:pimeloyl-ACP methyl ester carboxylesterase